MSIVTLGRVKNGVVIPNVLLPEGANVELFVHESPAEITPELQEELDAWERAGAGTVEMVERLAEEMDADETLAEEQEDDIISYDDEDNSDFFGHRDTRKLIDRWKKRDGEWSGFTALFLFDGVLHVAVGDLV